MSVDSDNLRQTVIHVIEDFLVPAIIGHDPLQISHVHGIMDRTVKGHPYAKAALDFALYDIAGKSLGVPAYQLLSGCYRQWVPLEKISPNLQLAVIASEDGNFCDHRGVDWGAVREVINKAKSLKAVRGASTIPMQVAKNLYLWERRNYVRKALEVPLAYAMTTLWPKRRMLEVYLNIAQWGPHTYGAEAASRRYFGKPASRLTRRQAVLLAAALPNPHARNPARPNRKMRLIASAVQRRLPYISKRADCVLKP